MAASFARPKATLRQALCSSFYPQLRTLFGAVGTAEKCHTGREQMQQPGMLFYHFVRAREQRRRKFDPERLGCLEIEHQPQLGGSLYRQIGRLCAL
jgi:hypothetical protein